VAFPRRQDHFTTRLLPDGYVAIIDPDRKHVHTLPPLGAMVWEFCDGEHSLDQIVLEITKVADLPADRNLRSEITHLMDSLSREGLLLGDPGELKE